MHMLPTTTDPVTAWDGDVVEIFAGPGGWSEALTAIGVVGVTRGYDWDRDACATAEAAGHKRVRADVSMVDLTDLADLERLLMIGSPPCQSFSKAGRQKGKLDAPRILRHVARIREAGRWLHYSREGWHDPRSPLVLEPLRWALTLKPEAIALEQVEGVLPLWNAIADVLRGRGYHAATGVLSSEQYGVPQTRKRAFLVARRCPQCLHGISPLWQRCPLDVQLPAPTHRPYRKGVARHEGDPRLRPWVSMADALGWGMTERPYLTIAVGTGAGGTDPAALGGSGARRTLHEARDSGLWQLRRQSAQANATVRSEDEPAPTITSAHDRAERVWEPTPPSPETEPVRVSVAEAAALQSMRPDYPFQGSRTAQYRQVGDMVPPLLAYAVLRAVIGA